MSERRSMLTSSPRQQRVDEWAIITEQKTIEEQKAKQYEYLLAEEKRRRLKEHLDVQIQLKQQKQVEQRQLDDFYASEARRRVEEVKMLEKLKQQEKADKRKEVESHNKTLFNGVVDSSVREEYQRTSQSYSMDIGYAAQLERRRQAELAKRHMIDELDRQIQEKEKAKLALKQKQIMTDKLNLSLQNDTFQHRRKENQHTFRQNTFVYDHYKNILQKQHIRDSLFDYSRIELQAQKKMEEQIKKANLKDEERRLSNLRMKQVLDQQVRIREQKKREEQRVNPEELSYGLIGKMLSNRNHYNNSRQQQYYMELQKQIEQKQRIKDAEKYMTQQQIKLNLNQLNRAVEGKFADNTYIDRSIHALSEPHSLNVTLIDAKVQRPEVEAIKPTLQALKNRKKERLDHPGYHNNF